MSEKKSGLTATELAIFSVSHSTCVPYDAFLSQ
jgi:hypothetical protein